VRERVRGGPFESSKNFNGPQIYFLGILELKRAASSWRARIYETPHAGGRATTRMRAWTATRRKISAEGQSSCVTKAYGTGCYGIQTIKEHFSMPPGRAVFRTCFLTWM